MIDNNFLDKMVKKTSLLQIVALYISYRNAEVVFHLNFKDTPAMRSTFNRLMRDESGVTAIEYGLIAALIAVVIIVAVTAVGTNLTNVFTTVSGKLAAAN